jgi:hypothetical protein
MHVWKRRLAKYARWLHIYTSMMSFVVVFFFAVTGWTLNHADRFSGRERITRTSGTVDVRWTNTRAAPVAKPEIVEAIRRAQRVSGAVSDFRTDDEQISITFKGPGYSADASVDRRSGKYDLSESRLGLVAIVNDLHKGRDTGTVWKAVIDVSAALLTFVSLTGLVLIYYIHKHRLAGVILLLAGGALAMTLYAFVVP